VHLQKAVFARAFTVEFFGSLDAADGWKLRLVQEQKAAKLDFDANAVFG